MQKINFIDLAGQYQQLKPEIDARIQAVLDHGRYIMGPEVRELETRLAAYVGVKHAIGVADGTTALMVALMALNIKPGDEIITTPFTFIATGEVIALLGAVPVFVDIDPQTFNISAAAIADAITDKTKAILPVSLFGQCADMDAINAIAVSAGVPVIEDAAQSFGAEYRGHRSGALSTIACTSFFPSKPLGCYGDGGACFTNDDALAARMASIRVHGQQQRYVHTQIGINGRLDTIQAAVLLAKLDYFPAEVAARFDAGARYSKLIKSTPMADVIVPPNVLPELTSVYAQYTVRVPNRAAVIEHMKAAGVPTAVHYPVCLHQQPIFAEVAHRVESAHHAELAAQQVMSLPMYPGITPELQHTIVSALNDAVAAAAPEAAVAS